MSLRLSRRDVTCNVRSVLEGQPTRRGSDTESADPTSGRGDRRQALAAAIRSAYTGRLTQRELAGHLGVAQNTVSRWATGEVEPRLDDIAAIEVACGLVNGHILRASGYVDDEFDPMSAVASDHRLDNARRDLLLATYTAALAQSERLRAAAQG